MPADFIPRPDAEFDRWFHGICLYAEAKTSGGEPEWPEVPPSAVAALFAAYGEWWARYEPTWHPHAPEEARAKGAARERAERAMRLFARVYAFADSVTGEDRAAMGIRAEHAPPADRIEISLAPSAPGEAAIGFRAEGSESCAAPPGCVGAVLAWAFLDRPPKGHGELASHASAAAAPFAISLEEGGGAKALYVAAAWQGESGMLGPLSAMLCAGAAKG